MIEQRAESLGPSCVVCANPRGANNAGQIRWHNAGHPAPAPPLVNSTWTGSGHRLPVTVVVRPGDRLIYESSPNEWQELSVAALVGPDPRQVIRECVRCHRRVQGPRSLGEMIAGMWGRMIAR